MRDIANLSRTNLPVLQARAGLVAGKKLSNKMGLMARLRLAIPQSKTESYICKDVAFIHTQFKAF